MIKLLVPTRNRPSSLKALFRYLEIFYPDSELIVADGSDNTKKDLVEKICVEFKDSLSIELKTYPEELPFFDRIIDALLSCDDDIVAMGADDDYPLMDVLNDSYNLLESDNRFISVVPADVVLTLRENGKLTSRLSHSRNVLHSDPINRVKDYSYWHFATSYGVTYKSLLLDRYRMMSKYNCASFIDFQIGIKDAIDGCIKAIPEIGYIRTQTYEHEYFRATDSLVFLRKSERILKYRDYLTSELSSVSGNSEADARKLADMLVSRRIGDLTGGSAPTKLSFKNTKQFKDSTLQRQYKIFYELYKDGFDIRDKHIAKLSYARDVLFSDVASSENSGVVNNYENI